MKYEIDVRGALRPLSIVSRRSKRVCALPFSGALLRTQKPVARTGVQQVCTVASYSAARGK